MDTTLAFGLVASVLFAIALGFAAWMRYRFVQLEVDLLNVAVDLAEQAQKIGQLHNPSVHRATERIMGFVDVAEGFSTNTLLYAQANMQHIANVSPEPAKACTELDNLIASAREKAIAVTIHFLFTKTLRGWWLMMNAQRASEKNCHSSEKTVLAGLVEAVEPIRRIARRKPAMHA